MNFNVDSASTAEEVCNEINNKLGMKDTFGFSIFITLFDKVMSLGNGEEHIMDAISNCEQYAKELKGSERAAAWRLFLRKEIFAPWHNPSEDAIATDLIYNQIIRGVNFGEYTCNSEKDIAMVAALQYYAEHGENLKLDILRDNIPDYIPRALVKPETFAKWEKSIEAAFKRSRCYKERLPRINAKEDIVLFAKITWTMLFSRFFEVVRTSGPELITNNLIIAVNWTGLTFIDEKEQIIVSAVYNTVL